MQFKRIKSWTKYFKDNYIEVSFNMKDYENMNFKSEKNILTGKLKIKSQLKNFPEKHFR